MCYTRSMTAPKYHVGPSTYGSIWVSREDYPFTCAAEPRPREGIADFWNDRALTATEADVVDVYLLMCQYLLSGEIGEVWEHARPTCTHGTVGSGYCPEVTEHGSLYCSKHSA